MAAADPPAHLSLVLDLSPAQWHASAQPDNAYPLSLKTFLAQLLAFLNAHIACKHENSLAVFGALPSRSVMLYSSAEPAPDTSPAPDANSYRPFRVLDHTVVSRITDEFDALNEDEDQAPVALVGALTKALCYINRIAASEVGDDPAGVPEPRILILSVSPDQSTSYIPVMNAIFSAQKMKIAIDVCQLHGPETVFLQQAAHLTGGAYIYLERRDALLQYLTMAFLPSPSIRQFLAVPTQDKIDLRASCFCHKRIVDVGFVCSVCLSIFCQPIPVCSTCRTKFPIKTLQRLNASKPPTSTPTPSAPSTPVASQAPTPQPGQQQPVRRPNMNALPSSNTIRSNGGANGVPRPGAG